MTDHTKKSNPWRWTEKKEAYFQKWKEKVSSTHFALGTRAKGEIILVTDASDVSADGIKVCNRLLR